MNGPAAEILLVDDSSEDCELALQALRAEAPAPRVAVAHDGLEALDYLTCSGSFAGRTDSTPPKLVILDLDMPIMTGLEVLRRIRADPATMEIPVVVLTGGYRPDEIREALKLGVNSYFLKPTSYDEYEKMLRVIRAAWL
jgi:CheY-like chemotaxis protein